MRFTVLLPDRLRDPALFAPLPLQSRIIAPGMLANRARRKQSRMDRCVGALAYTNFELRTICRMALSARDAEQIR
jgi:hypothetical protein